MRTTLIVSAVASTLLLTACPHNDSTNTNSANETDAKGKTVDESNPLFQASPHQYQAPDYANIRLEHYRPAFAAGMEQHRAEIDAIANSEEAPTFDNTIVAMEKSGALLRRTAGAFFSLTGTMSNDEVQAIQAEIAPKLTAHTDAISLDPKLFARVDAIYEARSSLEGEDLRVVEEIHRKMVRAGAKLDEDTKAKIKTINAELSTLTTEFGNNLLNATEASAVVVDDKAELAGLSDQDIAGLAAAAEQAGHEGKFLISLLNTTRQPIMTRLDNRALRERVWKASANRAVTENGPVLERIVALRADKAKLLGYETWADYVLESQMAKTPEAVLKILDDLAPKVVKKAKREAKDIQKVIKKSGGEFELAPWDWTYYAEKVRAEKFDLDEGELRAYFELDNVMTNGVFFTMGELFGIRFEERTDLPTYHPDVRTFEVFDESGESIALFYADYFAREGKRGGAWMDALVPQSHLLGQKPVIVNCLNIPKPAPGEPALLTFDEVTTMFHEMGHGVHGMFSDAKYPTLAGTSVPRDFVEFPSQFQEDWAFNSKVLANYTKHYETGEAIPKPLLDKMLASRKFNQGFDSLEYIGSALLDMEWHMIAAGTDTGDVEAFERAALDKHGILYAPVPPRYKSPYFAHTFAGGYSAGYYAYLWTEVLAADAFAYMGTQGGLTRANGDQFRDLILSRGNTIDPMQQYVNYRGQEPTVDALLVRRGLVE